MEKEVMFTPISFIVNFLSGEKLKVETNPATFLRKRKPISIMGMVKREVPLITSLLREEEKKDA